jgi:hypothetical protein
MTQLFGKVKLLLQRNRYFIESPDPDVLEELLADEVIAKARVKELVISLSLFAFSRESSDSRRGVVHVGWLVLQDQGNGVITSALFAPQSIQIPGASGAPPEDGDDLAKALHAGS